MRLPWLNRSHIGRARLSRRRRRLAAEPRVRQLERRRVLDAAVQSLLVTPVVSESPSTNIGSEERLVFDWSVADQPLAAGAEAYQAAAAEGDPVSPVGFPDEEPMNVPPVLVVAVDQTVGEGQLLKLSGVNAPPLGLFIDDGGPGTHTVTVNWGDSPNDEELNFFFANGSGSIVGTHIYALEGTYEVRVRVEDGEGASDTKSFFVTVENVPPVLTVAPDQMVNEGAVLNLSGVNAPPLGLIADDGKQDTHTATVDWGDGTVEMAAVQQGMGSAAIVGTHTYADDGVYEVKVRAQDDDGGLSETRSFFVTVKNVPPVLTVALDQTVNEGAVLDLSGMGAPPLGLIVDDGKLDTHTATIDWGDGTMEMAMIQQGMGSAAIVGTHIYLENGIYEVKVRAQDDDGGMSELKSFFVTVKNVPPVLTVASDQMVNEGAVLNLSGVGAPRLGMIVDDGKLDTHTATIDWGDGTMEAAMIEQGMGSAAIGGTHIYVENGLYEVKVRAADDDGGVSETKSFFVTVKNVPPVLTVALDQTVNEGAVLNLSGMGAPPLGLLADDGKLDTHTATLDWGDGTSEMATVLQGMGSAALVGSHIYADNGLYEVKVRATDDDGGMSETKSFFVTVNNVVPSLSNINNLQVNEGSSFTLISLNVLLSDPGFDNPANPILGGELQETFAVRSINWGDGTPTETGTLSIVNRVSGSQGVPTTAQFGNASHTYADDGDYQVTVRVADDDMGAFADPAKFVSGVAGVDFVDLVLTIHVNNVAPSFGPIVPTVTTINESQGISFTAQFSDPGFDNELNPNPAVLPLIADPRHESFTYDINWGDGRQAQAAVPVVDMNGSVGVASTGMFGGSHVYADDGVYTVTLTIRDDNGGVRSETFEVTVRNVNPSFVPTPLGASFEADDVTRQGITRIRVSFNDPGFDNTANPNPAAPPTITDTKHESFTHLLNWGDGTIDAVHTYADSGVYTVAVTMTGPGGTQTFSFPGFNSNLRPVLTLVSGQKINDLAVPVQSFTYLINWGDGAVQTVPLMLKAPSDPLFNNGQTTVLGLQRTSGGETVLTSGSFQAQHMYLGPPNPLNPTADIRITVTVMDDNNGSVSDFVLVDNPGIQTTTAAIDTTPEVPPLEFAPPPATDVLIDQQFASAQSQQASPSRIVRSDVLITSERYLELEVVSPDGKTVVSRHRIRDEALNDLRAFFATLPDNHYRIYLVRTENNSRRLIMDVYVRNGRVIDPSDDSEGTRDRPPTTEQSSPAEALPLEQNPLLEQLPLPPPNEAPAQDAMPLPQAGQDVRPADNMAVAKAEQSGVMFLPLRQSVRWMVPLAGLGLAAGGAGWSRQVRSALETADDRDWQRLRRAGQSGRPQGSNQRPNASPGGYNKC